MLGHKLEYDALTVLLRHIFWFGVSVYHGVESVRMSFVNSIRCHQLPLVTNRRQILSSSDTLLLKRGTHGVPGVSEKQPTPAFQARTP